MNGNMYTLEQVQEILELVNKYGVREIQAPAAANIKAETVDLQRSQMCGKQDLNLSRL